MQPGAQSMRENDADRAAAQRSRQEEQSRAEQAAIRGRTAASEVNTLCVRAERAVERLLRERATRNYAGIEQINVHLPRSPLGRMIMGRERYAKVGAYKTSVSVEVAERVFKTYFVLSNGRLALGTGSFTVSDLGNRVLHPVDKYTKIDTIDTLRRIVAALEAM